MWHRAKIAEAIFGELEARQPERLELGASPIPVSPDLEQYLERERKQRELAREVRRMLWMMGSGGFKSTRYAGIATERHEGFYGLH